MLENATPNQVLLVFFLLSLCMAALLSMGAFMIWKMLDYGKSWVVFPSVAGMPAEVKRRRITNGMDVRQIAPDVKAAYPLNDAAAHMTKRGRLYIIHPQTGWNLKAPLAQEKPEGVDTETWHRMTVCDPLFTYRVLKADVTRKVISAQDTTREHWLVRVAPMAMIVAIIAIGVLGFVIWRFAPTGAA